MQLRRALPVLWFEVQELMVMDQGWCDGALLFRAREGSSGGVDLGCPCGVAVGGGLSPEPDGAPGTRRGRASSTRALDGVLGRDRRLVVTGSIMALLFVAGVMNLLWVATITVFVLIERVLPRGDLVGRVAGAALVIAGVVLGGGVLTGG